MAACGDRRKALATLTRSDARRLPLARTRRCAAHDAFRKDMALFSRALAAVNPSQDWQLRNLAEYFDIYAALVHEHHDNEESIFFPWIATRVALPPKLSADHKTLVAWLVELEGLIKKLRDTPGSQGAARQQLLAQTRELWAKYDASFREHIGEEDVLIWPLMRAHFTLKEYEAVTAKIMKNAQSLGHYLLPWFCAAGDKDMVAGVLGMLPPPVRLLLRRKWIPHWHTYVIPLLVSIVDPGVKSPHKRAKPSAWWCCGAYSTETAVPPSEY